MSPRIRTARFLLIVGAFFLHPIWSVAQISDSDVVITIDKHVSCPAGNDAQISVEITNMVENVTYFVQWKRVDDGTIKDNISFDGDASGYAKVVFPADGVSKRAIRSGLISLTVLQVEPVESIINVIEIKEPDLLLANVIQPTCGAPTGTVEFTSPVNTKGGVYSFRYSDDGGSTYQGSTTFSGLDPGNYNLRVEVTSHTICYLDDVATVNAVPIPPAKPTASITHPSCVDPNGSIAITNAQPENQYSVNGGAWAYYTTPFEPLPSGPYFIQVRLDYDNSCTSSDMFTINPEPTRPAAPTITVTQPACGGPAKGEIEVTAPVGADYAYSINGTDYQVSTTFSNLDPNTYNVTARYISNPTCVSDPTVQTINAPVGAPEISAPSTITNPSTPDANDGQIAVTLVGGTGTSPFTYFLTDNLGNPVSNSGAIGATSYTFTGLDEGNYTVYVTDASSCTSASETGIILDAPGGCINPTITLNTGNNNQGVCTGEAIDNIQYTVTGDFSNVSVTGLPAGVSGNLVGSTFTISGTPSVGGNFNFTVTATALVGCTNATATGSLSVSALPAVTISYDNDPYCQTPGSTATVTINGQIINYVEATYGGANLQTDFNNVDFFTSSSCPGVLSVTIPVGATITGVDVEYQMWTTAFPAGQFIVSQQRSYLSCVSPGGTSESEVFKGIGNVSGTYDYSRSNISIANGVVGGGEVQFRLHAGRVWPTGGCSTAQHRVNNNTWKVRVYYAETHHFTASPAGLIIDPITGEIDVENSTPGTYTVTYEFGDGVCTGTTSTTVTISPLPTATISYDGGPFCASGSVPVTLVGTGGGTFSALPVGLSIDANTGEVNLSASEAGTYTVTYDFSNGTCSSSTTTQIIVNAVPEATISYAGSPY